MAPLPEQDRPDFKRPEYKALVPVRTRSRDFCGGTDEVHAGGVAYLPKWSGEENDLYAQRSTLTEVFGGYPRSIEAGVGMVFADPPKIEDGADPFFDEFVKDVDSAGTPFDQFTKASFFDGMEDGVVGIFVDHPGTPAGLYLSDEQQLNVRPYWVPLLASQIINWTFERRANQLVLTRLVLELATEVPVGKYGVTMEPRWRVYTLGPDSVVTFEVYRLVKVENDERFELVGQPGLLRNMDEIPLAIGYMGRESAPVVAKPPLDDLLDITMGHYRVSADHRWLMHLCHAPTFVLEGWTEQVNADGSPAVTQIKIGPNGVIKTPPGCKAGWVQADPDALASAEKTMERQQQQMAALGMAFLARDKTNTQETATGRRLDAAGEHATLSSAAQGLRLCVEKALRLVAKYRKLSVAPAVTVTTSYDEAMLDAQTITALSGLATASQITLKTLLDRLKSGNVFPGLDVEAEVVAAEAEGLAKLLNAPPAPEPVPVAA